MIILFKGGEEIRRIITANNNLQFSTFVETMNIFTSLLLGNTLRVIVKSSTCHGNTKAPQKEARNFSFYFILYLECCPSKRFLSKAHTLRTAEVRLTFKSCL